jgi:hypothetical protein
MNDVKLYDICNKCNKKYIFFESFLWLAFEKEFSYIVWIRLTQNCNNGNKTHSIV